MKPMRPSRTTKTRSWTRRSRPPSSPTNSRRRPPKTRSRPDPDTAESSRTNRSSEPRSERKPAARSRRPSRRSGADATESTESTDRRRPWQPAVATVVPTSRNDETAATLKTAAPQTAAVAFAAPATRGDHLHRGSAATIRLCSVRSGPSCSTCTACATRLVGGPRSFPRTARSPCTVPRCGSTALTDTRCPADWYIPAGAEENPPQRLIYLQHGFLASGPWYSHTAAALAEQTNSIVVAPSITSNFLSCDACWLGAPPMQQAVANLFEDDNTALADSALAAGYTGPIPDRVVLVGHSPWRRPGRGHRPATWSTTTPSTGLPGSSCSTASAWTAR